MDSSRAYNEESRQNVVDSKQGKAKGFLSTVYSPLSTEKGLALVMVLVLSAILLAIMAGLIYMVISGTQISGIQKRYKTALEAGIGGADVTFQLLQARGNPFTVSEAALINFSITASPTCLNDKLNKSTADWDSTCNSSLTIPPYDMIFQLGTAPFPTYTVYSKIVDTVEGNSGGDEGLLKSGVVSSNTGEVPVKSVPYLYTIEVLSQNTDNPQERAMLSILYQY